MQLLEQLVNTSGAQDVGREPPCVNLAGMQRHFHVGGKCEALQNPDLLELRHTPRRLGLRSRLGEFREFEDKGETSCGRTSSFSQSWCRKRRVPFPDTEEYNTAEEGGVAVRTPEGPASQGEFATSSGRHRTLSFSPAWTCEKQL